MRGQADSWGRPRSIPDGLVHHRREESQIRVHRDVLARGVHREHALHERRVLRPGRRGVKRREGGSDLRLLSSWTVNRSLAARFW